LISNMGKATSGTNAVAGMGIAFVIHQTTTRVPTVAVRQAAGCNPSGADGWEPGAER
jgi:hypothetical protein